MSVDAQLQDRQRLLAKASLTKLAIQQPDTSPFSCDERLLTVFLTAVCHACSHVHAVGTKVESCSLHAAQDLRR